MAFSPDPIATLSILAETRKNSGIRSPLMLPMATTRTISMLPSAFFSLHSSCFSKMQFWRKYKALQKGSDAYKGALIVVRASLGTDGNDSSESELPPFEESIKAVSVENLPLESKQKMLLEQRLKMKLAKKIRLRRKRLNRKRRWRKMGRWPPSKMKKNKNV